MLKVYEFLNVCLPDALVFIMYEREQKTTKSNLSYSYDYALKLIDELSEIDLNYYIQHFAINPDDPMIITLYV